MNDPARLKSAFVGTYGYWDEDLDRVLALDPEFFGAFLSLTERGDGARLEPSLRRLLLIAINASVTHLNEAALSTHIEAALAHGSPREHILEVLQLVSVLGIHGYMLGAPMLLTELRQLGREAEVTSPGDEERVNVIRRRFQESRGYWSDLLEDMAAAAPDFFEHYRAFSSVPWGRAEGLPAKTKELVYLAIDVSTTHLHREGTLIHMRNALANGAHPREIVEVFQLVSTMGFQSWLIGTRVLAQAIERMG
jgi:alkylhydroperoxidase/carboxymuconolactone decarboxylase family protein YurZ